MDRNCYILRLYESYVALEADYTQRETGYDLLAGYFRGLNADEVAFAESQPIILNYLPDGSKKMQLFVGMTREGTVLEEPPAATLPGCRLVAGGGELCAVLRFEGYITPATAQEALQSLKTMQRRPASSVYASMALSSPFRAERTKSF
jgi:hypothetical protein